jgi:hypoxanthine phosphoribosyltransferase
MNPESVLVEIDGNRFRVLRNAEEIRCDVDRMAAKLRDLAGDRVPVFIGLLKGSFILLADLIRAYGAPHEIDFLSLTRFDPSQREQTAVKVLHDLSANITGRLVIVVEGIRTAGTKIEYVDQFLHLHDPQAILHCALVQQKGSIGVPTALHTRGFEIGNEFVVGYGLDLDERYRNLPFIGVLEGRSETGPTG